MTGAERFLKRLLECWWRKDAIELIEADREAVRTAERERAARLLDKRAEQVSRPVSLAVHRWHGQELKQLAALIRSGAEPDAE